MTIDDLLKQDSEWLKGTGPNSDIVMSSRTRLARNIEKEPFSNRAGKAQLQEILARVRDAAAQVDFLKGSTFFDLKAIS